VDTEKFSWLEKVTNEEVLKRVNEDRQILHSIWQRKLQYIGHVLSYDGLLHEIIEGGMKDEPTIRRRIQMLHDLEMMVALLYSDWQLQTERDGNT